MLSRRPYDLMEPGRLSTPCEYANTVRSPTPAIGRTRAMGRQYHIGCLGYEWI